MTKVVFFCQTAKYLRVKCYFSGKNLAEYILLTIFALDYCNDVLTNMRKTYNDKLLVLVLFCMYSSAAFAQKEDMSTILDIHHLMAYLVAALLISVFVMAYFNRVFYYREKEVRNRSERLNTQMGLVMDSNKTRVWTYDRQKNVFRLLSYVTGESKDLTAIDFSQDFDRDDFLEMREVIHSILEKETLSQSLKEPYPREPTLCSRSMRSTSPSCVGTVTMRPPSFSAYRPTSLTTRPRRNRLRNCNYATIRSLTPRLWT